MQSAFLITFFAKYGFSVIPGKGHFINHSEECKLFILHMFRDEIEVKIVHLLGLITVLIKVKLFVSIKKVIWDQLLAFRALIIEKKAFLTYTWRRPCTR